MKKLISYLGIFLFLIISMFFTNQSIKIYRKNDPIMKMIEDYSSKYYINSNNALIEKNDMISGSYGREVDVLESYYKMKSYGSYNELLTVFKEIKPSISIDDNYDKYLIRGNGKKREIALMFILENEKNISSYVRVLKQNNIKATFFVDGTLLEKKEYMSLIKNYEIELLSYNNSYEEVFFKSSLSYLESITGVKPKYCFTSIDNTSLLNLCSSLKMHTIKGKIYSRDLLRVVRKDLKNSMIIPLKDVSIDELSTIVEYLNKKGYSFVSGNELFREEDA